MTSFEHSLVGTPIQQYDRQKSLIFNGDMQIEHPQVSCDVAHQPTGSLQFVLQCWERYQAGGFCYGSDPIFHFLVRIRFLIQQKRKLPIARVVELSSVAAILLNHIQIKNENFRLLAADRGFVSWNGTEIVYE